MNLASLLKKCAQGEQLSEKEKNFLASCPIPDSANELAEQNRELKNRIDELESRDLSDAEKIRKAFEGKLGELNNSLTGLSEERDAARRELAELRHTGLIDKLAQEKNFTDPEYLGYLCKKAQVDLNDQGSVERFFDNLKNQTPKLFKIELQSGPERNFPRSESSVNSGAERDIAAMLAEAPDLAGTYF